MGSDPLKRRTVLILAFQFPPFGGSSGVFRTLNFTRYLPSNGWSPIVLTASEKAYESIDNERTANLPRDLIVMRSFALDTKRHLSYRGKYPNLLSIPDRWGTWFFGAIPKGIYAIYRRDIDVIYTTFPIATTVLIGLYLKRITGKPWVVDFRDPMIQDDYPADPVMRRMWQWIEKETICRGNRFLFTAPSARDMYLKRYPILSPDKCLVVPNGYDENDFEEFTHLKTRRGGHGRTIRLLHSGLIYREERNPEAFFIALSHLKRDGMLSQESLSVELRASGSEDFYRSICKNFGIEDLIRFSPHITHREALREMTEVDALLLFQASNCNAQIPAKVYEYLRLGKPILALTDNRGDTARLLRETGGATIADLADEDAISRGVVSFLEQVQSGTHLLPDQSIVRQFSREAQASRLAGVLDSLCVNMET